MVSFINVTSYSGRIRGNTMNAISGAGFIIVCTIQVSISLFYCLKFIMCEDNNLVRLKIHCNKENKYVFRDKNQENEDYKLLSIMINCNNT